MIENITETVTKIIRFTCDKCKCSCTCDPDDGLPYGWCVLRGRDLRIELCGDCADDIIREVKLRGCSSPVEQFDVET